MKKFTLSFSLILIFQLTFAQTESTLDFAESKDTSIFDVKLRKNTENDFVLSVSGKQFSSGTDDRFVDRGSSTFTGVCSLTKQNHSIHSKQIANYPFTVLDAKENNNTIVAIGNVDNTKIQTIAGAQMTTSCQNLIVAKSNSEGEDLVTYVEPNCDFKSFYSSIFYEGNYHILYLAEGGRYLLKLNESLEFQSKTAITDLIVSAVPSALSNSFLVSIADNQNWESQKLSNLHFDGSVDDVTNFFNYPVENRVSVPKSILDSDNGWIYGYTASDDAELNIIYKYSLEGELLGQYNIEHKHLGWIIKNDNLVVFSQTYYEEENSNPINLTVFNQSFTPIRNSNYGVSQLIVTDVHLDSDFDEYLISGFVDSHFGDETIDRKASKIYSLEGSLTDLLINPLERNSSFYYPNPSNDSEVFMKLTTPILPESQENIEMVFIDISGKKFDTIASFIDNDLIKVDVSGLPKGVYVGTLQQKGERIFSSKLVVK
jgi:hypothetical protein